MTVMLHPVHFVVGEDDFLAERATQNIIAQVSPAAEVTTLRAGGVTEGELLQATSPSLFAEERVVVIKDTDLAGKEPTELLLQAAVDPAPGMTLIIVHSGKGRNKSYVQKFRKVAEVHAADPLNQRDRQGWVMNEFRSHGIRPTPTPSGRCSNRSARIYVSSPLRSRSWWPTPKTRAAPTVRSQSPTCGPTTPAWPRCPASISPTKPLPGAQTVHWRAHGARCNWA